MSVTRGLGVVSFVLLLLAATPTISADGVDGGTVTGDGSTSLGANGGAGDNVPPDTTPGDGGDGGIVTIDTTAPIAGDISASANGGTGGQAPTMGGTGAMVASSPLRSIRM